MSNERRFAILTLELMAYEVFLSVGEQGGATKQLLDLSSRAEYGNFKDLLQMGTKIHESYCFST